MLCIPVDKYSGEKESEDVPNCIKRWPDGDTEVISDLDTWIPDRGGYQTATG
jgi:hypothetical protein